MTTSTLHEMTSDQAMYMFPASFTQEGLWFLDQLEPESAVYNLSFAIGLRRLLDVEALQRSLHTIMQRHEALRTTFRMVEGQAVQVIAPTLSIPLPLVDLRALPEVEREAEAQRLAKEEAQRPFDLSQGPLVRTTLLQLGAEEVELLLSMHHIISDGWSLDVFFHELANLYEAFASGQPSPLPELPIQYADFAVWQREGLQGEVLSEQLAYWKQQLAGMPAGLELPSDRPRLPVPTSRGAMYCRTLPKRLTDALKALSRREEVTLYMTLVAVFQTLLHRYTGQEDLVIGTVTAGRTQVEAEALIGFFANTLVLRTDLSGNPTFRELLRRVREVIVEAQVHQELPFEYLVKELHPTRALGQNPLFQVMLSLDSPLPPLPGWMLTPREVETGTSKFELSLRLDDRAEGLISRFEYSTDLFDEATIARMAGHWQTLLEGVVADPGRQLAMLPLLREAERHQLLVEWNATQAEYPRDRRVHELFEEQVERTPEAIAVVFEDVKLTYWELNRRANQLAHYLQKLGVGPEVLVGVCVERSLKMVVGLLSILKAGGAYVPLDPTYPQERLAFMLADTQMPVLLTQQHLVARLPEQHPQLVCIDTDWQTIGQQSERNPVNQDKGEQLAYVIYTSGSTGQPKGVLVEHRAIAAHCWAITQIYELRAEDCVLQFSTFNFDASLEQILPTLLVGARLVMRGQEIWSPADLLHKVKDLGLTVINLPPAYWHHVLQEWAQASQQLLNHQLRLVILGGDRLLSEALQLWRQTPLRSVRLLNAYGPTETTITATIFDITRHFDKDQPCEKVPIGRPLPNRTIYILDRVGNPIPVGVAGELHIGGDLLARGYLHRPELTAEHFVPNPFSQHPQARLYRTGDLARYLPDGTIEFLRRIDQQVKIRGFRIELGEIEEVLSQHPEVREAVVEVQEDMPGEKYLAAYVVVSKEKNVESQVLRGYLKQKLPEYMIPAAFVQLENLPLMSNGKIDRRALPAPESTERLVGKTFVAPTLPLHHQLVHIWEDLLGVRPIGIKDNFFDLGGHSLLAIRLFDRIAQVCGKKLPLSTLFAGATIEDLATALMGEANVDSRAPLVTVQVGEARRPFFYLHGEWRGGAFYCLELARYLGPDQPFYLLEPYKFDGLQVPPTFEAIAAAHLKSLRAVQPEGPYLLGGYCNGALMAYEMARQLRAAGQTVDLLVLMDPGASTAINRLVHAFIRCIGYLVRLRPEKQLSWFLCLQHMYRYLRFSHYRRLKNSELLGTVEQGETGRRRSKGGFTPLSLGLKALVPKVEILRQDYPNILDWVASGYAPGLYSGKITFFWMSEEPRRPVEWRKVVKAREGKEEIHVIPGNHKTSRTEHLSVLAEHLHECLNKAQTTVMS